MFLLGTSLTRPLDLGGRLSPAGLRGMWRSTGGVAGSGCLGRRVEHLFGRRTPVARPPVGGSGGMTQLARVPGFVSRHGSIHSHGMSSCDMDMSLSAVQSRHHGSKTHSEPSIPPS